MRDSSPFTPAEYDGGMATVRLNQLLPFLLGLLVGVPLVMLISDWRANSESFPTYVTTRNRAPSGQTKIPEIDIGRTKIVIGRLGRPLGDKVTIQGQLQGKQKSTEKYFRIDSVNDQPLTRSVYLMIAGLDEWPDRTDATFRGCEVGIIRTGVHHRPPQEIDLRFHVDEVVEPKNIPFDYKAQWSR